MSSELKIDEVPWSPLGEHVKIDNSSAQHDGHEHEEEPWLLSYADMVTLLMCFFILFFSTDQGNIKLKDPAKLMEQMRALERMLGIENDLLPESEKFEFAKTSYDLQNLSASLGKELTYASADKPFLHSLGVPRPGIIEVVFQQDFFFNAGGTDLSKPAKDSLIKISQRVIKTLPDAHIEVEGHTDSSPTRGGRIKSNWELSGIRAASVVDFLEKQGFPAEKLDFKGFGNQKPLMPEVDSKGRRIARNMAVNRRIVVKIVTEEMRETTKSK